MLHEVKMVVEACNGAPPPPLAVPGATSMANGSSLPPGAAGGGGGGESGESEGGGTGSRPGSRGGGDGSGGGGGSAAAVMKSFESVASMLEQCEKELQDYANAKRTDFPRFFFLSSAELLDVLAKGSEPVKVLKHVPKILIDAYHLHLVPAGSSDGAASARYMNTRI